MNAQYEPDYVCVCVCVCVEGGGQLLVEELKLFRVYYAGL